MDRLLLMTGLVTRPNISIQRLNLLDCSSKDVLDICQLRIDRVTAIPSDKERTVDLLLESRVPAVEVITQVVIISHSTKEYLVLDILGEADLDWS